MAEARPLRDNAHKIPIGRRAITRALALAAEGSPAFRVSD
jgi:hypothetical protein